MRVEFIDKQVTPVDPSLYQQLCWFLYDEASMLDRNDLRGWSKILAKEINYSMPVRTYTELGKEPRKIGLDTDGYYLEDYDSLMMRIDILLDPKKTIAESVPDFTRRFITNVRAYLIDGQPNQYFVTSSILFYRTRALDKTPYIFSGERNDIIINNPENEGFQLLRREIMMDEGVLHTPHLTFLL
jgi:3-phenylpropionate/cinnamic acid dioxygenase small subunit